MDADLKYMRQETTNEALDFIKSNGEMRQVAADIANGQGGIRYKAKKLKDQAEQHAVKHDHNFGELFYAELDLVLWNKVVREFENVA